jgi:hypothetical protein
MNEAAQSDLAAARRPPSYGLKRNLTVVSCFDSIGGLLVNRETTRNSAKSKRHEEILF